MHVFKSVFTVLGGLGLLLYGITQMSSGLEKAAGEKLKKMIELFTKNRLMGVIVGAVVTMIIQSSSATTVMVVGFVNAGLMSLSQAIGIIMGANIGTTITGQIIAFKLTDYAPMFIAIGVTIWLVSNKKKNKDIAEIIIGFGILFLGMKTMSGPLKALKTLPAFQHMMTSLENMPVIGVFVGFIVTVIVQSSSASMGLLQSFAGQGLVSLKVAFPILFGENIGTCTTALISSINANKTAKRAALMHLLFNIVGTLIFMIILQVPVRYIVTKLSPNDVVRQIANAHTLFNVINVMILFPFAGLIVKAAMKLIPGRDEDVDGLKYLDTRIIETPSIAVGMASKEVLRMGKFVGETLDIAKNAILNKDETLTMKVFEAEKKINRMQKDITNYLIELTHASLSDEQHTIVTTLLNTVNDLERVGDHADNIAELAQYRIDNNVSLSDLAIEELRVMFDSVDKSYKKSLIAFKTADEKTAKQVLDFERQIDDMEKRLRANHIKRLNEGTCLGDAGIVFLDLISNLERVADHASNIALTIIDALN